MPRVLLCFSLKTEEVNDWVVFSKFKPRYCTVIAVLTLGDQ